MGAGGGSAGFGANVVVDCPAVVIVVRASAGAARTARATSQQNPRDFMSGLHRQS
jgi:hypothetical protein